MGSKIRPRLVSRCIWMVSWNHVLINIEQVVRKFDPTKKSKRNCAIWTAIKQCLESSFTHPYLVLSLNSNFALESSYFFTYFYGLLTPFENFHIVFSIVVSMLSAYWFILSPNLTHLTQLDN